MTKVWVTAATSYTRLMEEEWGIHVDVVGV